MDMFFTFLNTDLGKLFCSIFVFGVVCFLVVKLLFFIVDRVSVKIDPNALHWKLVKQCIKIVVCIIFILLVVDNVPSMSNLGTTLIACSSVLVAALGLASKDALGNAIDGVFISIFKPFAVDDRVRLITRNITGTVTDINLRYTSIKTIENNLLLIPNSIMNDEIIENSNIVDTKIKAFLDVTITYDSDLKKTKELLSLLVYNHPLFLDMRTDYEKGSGVEPVSIFIRNLGSSGVDIRVSLWSANINDSFVLCSELREQLLTVFKENDIHIPYQTIKLV